MYLSILEDVEKTFSACALSETQLYVCVLCIQNTLSGAVIQVFLHKNALKSLECSNWHCPLKHKKMICDLKNMIWGPLKAGR